MKDNLYLTENRQEIMVDSELTFATVKDLWQVSLPLLQSLTQWNFNLKQVTYSDSAGLALLLEWKRQAQLAKKSLVFQEVPDQLKKIALANKLQEILGFSD